MGPMQLAQPETHTTWHAGTEARVVEVKQFSVVSGTERMWPIGVATMDASPGERRLPNARWRPHVTDRFRALAESSDLEGYPSLEVLNEALQRIEFLLHPTTPTPSVLPGEDGTVELIWQRLGRDLQIVLGDEEGDWFWTRDRKTMDREGGPLEDLRDVLRDLLRQIEG